MANLVVSGLPAIAWGVGFVVVGALPIWFGAQVTGAASPTLARSVLALIVGVIGSVVGLVIGGPAVLLLAPLSFLLAFKFILDMSFGGAFMLCIVAVVGGFIMIKFIGAGFSVKGDRGVEAARAETTLPALYSLTLLKSPTSYSTTWRNGAAPVQVYKTI